MSTNPDRLDAPPAEERSATIFCRFESAYFPAREFETDPEWGRVHRVDGESSHTVMGDPVDDAEWELRQLGGA